VAEFDRAARLVAVATDGHRLSRWMCAAPEGTAGMPGIIVPRQAQDLIKGIVGDKGKVTVSLSDTKILFRSDSGSLLTKLVDGTFPDYQRIIPTGNEHRYRVKRAALSAAMARVSTVETKRGSAVKFGFGKDGVVALEAIGDDRSASDEVGCETEARETVEIGISGRYTAEMLAASAGDEVEFALQDNASPTLIVPVASDRQLFVIMPMRV
jgi:DNA polymerase-3 subunit beta